MNFSVAKFESTKGAFIFIFTAALFSFEAILSWLTSITFFFRFIDLLAPSFFVIIDEALDFGSIILQATL